MSTPYSESAELYDRIYNKKTMIGTKSLRRNFRQLSISYPWG